MPRENRLENSPGAGCLGGDFVPDTGQPGGLFFQKSPEKSGFPVFFLGREGTLCSTMFWGVVGVRHGVDRDPDEFSRNPRDPRGDLKSRENGAPTGIFRAADSGARQGKMTILTLRNTAVYQATLSRFLSQLAFSEAMKKL